MSIYRHREPYWVISFSFNPSARVCDMRRCASIHTSAMCLSLKGPDQTSCISATDDVAKVATGVVARTAADTGRRVNGLYRSHAFSGI